MVLAAALGAGVLFRDRLAAPPSAAPEQPRTLVQPTPAAVSEATAEPLNAAEPETPGQAVANEPSRRADDAVGPPSRQPAEPAAQRTSPEGVAEPPSGPADAVAQASRPEAVAEPTSPQAVAEPTSAPGQRIAESSAAQPTPEPTAVAEVGLPTGAQPSAPTADTSPPAPAPRPAPPRAATRTYTVQPRDTLKGIAARYGVSIASILANNEIPNPDSLVVGQVLVIPSR